MDAPTIAEMLKFANLQMAAEALYAFNTRKREPASLTPGDPFSLVGHDSGAIDPAILTSGNEHASRFTLTEAVKFAKEWVVKDHLSNTTTGFSGTLFFNSNTDEYVLSLRSTEFIDDALRDSYGTNKLEILDRGWAFGQITDMEAWYARLTRIFHEEVSAEQPKGALIQVSSLKLEEFRRCQIVPVSRCCLGASGAARSKRISAGVRSVPTVA